MKNKLLGGSLVKSQKGEESKVNEAETNSMKELNEHESRWRLLVFEVPHIH